MSKLERKYFVVIVLLFVASFCWDCIYSLVTFVAEPRSDRMQMKVIWLAFLPAPKIFTRLANESALEAPLPFNVEAFLCQCFSTKFSQLYYHL